MTDNDLIDEYFLKIGASALSIYCVLKRLADAKTWEVHTTVMALSERMGMSRPMVTNCIAVLAEYGLIEI